MGQPISFSCNINASSGTFNQWLFRPEGDDSYSTLEGDTATTLNRASFAPNDAGDYRCQISVQDPDGIVLSQPATASFFSELYNIRIPVLMHSPSHKIGIRNLMV